ncbi:site-specific integrase [Pseudomonas sp.]|uniref:tyrosine-type recombinase/integrase n=1 Tax=Pseudomonas sp. TaxID=306 RepID=UPI002486DC12|nr:site-specific integrase [Pseudomonas sp.]MDI1332414.1 tyrosine-type recombinase/integrase [Pseudomonas sp.]
MASTTPKIPKHIKLATDTCRDAKPQEKQYELNDTQVAGLQLRVNPGNTKTWVLRYRIRVGETWTNRRMTLGQFPDVSVAAARKEAENKKTDIDRGADPMGERRAQALNRADAIEAKKREEASRVCLSESYEKWMNSSKPLNRKDSGKSIRANFENNVLPLLGNKEMKDVRQADILEVTETILKRGANRQAQIAFSEMKQFFSFAVEREILTTNPQANLKKADVGKKSLPRERVLPPHEIRLLHQKMQASSLNRPTQICFMIALSTLCRIGEIGLAKWEEVNWAKKTWTIPAENTKNGQAITINLSKFALDHFNELRLYNGDSEWCVPNSKRDGPVYEKSLTKHAHDRQLPEGQPPTKGRTVQTRSLITSRENWTPHDLRRSGSTIMQQLGVSTETAERCLNHTVHTKVQKAYLHHNPLKEMNRAWRDLGQALEVIVGEDGETFLKALDDDFHKDPDDEIGMLGLVKQFHAKLVATN